MLSTSQTLAGWGIEKKPKKIAKRVDNFWEGLLD